MIRKLLFSMVMCAFAVSASAQATLVKQLNKRNASKSALLPKTAKLSTSAVTPTQTGIWVDASSLVSINKSARKAPMKAGEAYEEQFWWANTSSGYLGGYQFDITYPTTVDLGTMLPDSYIGAVVDSVAYFVYDKSVLKNVKVWLGSNVPNNVADWDGGCYDVTPTNDFSSKDDIANYVALAKPYTVTSAGCFVGFSFEATTQTAFPIVWTTESNEPEPSVNRGLIMRESMLTKGQWANLASEGMGNLAIMVHLQIPELPLAVKPSGLIESTALVNQETSVVAYVENECYKAINSIDYILTVGGVAQPEKTQTFDTPIPAKTESGFVIPLTLTETGYVDIEIEITKVNGETNNASVKKISGGVIAIEKSATRVAVAEEFTGTWCQYCPAGHVGLANLKRDFGGNIITLAGHADGSEEVKDPMQCDDYLDVIYYWASGFPDMAINRSYNAHPYAGLNETYEYGATQLVNAVNLVFPSEATVSMAADWTGADSTAIAVTAKAQFLYDRWGGTGDDYGFAFILSEDGMSGTTSEWLQVNAFSGAQGLPADLAIFTNASQNVQMSYDHVVVDAWDAFVGKSGSVPEVMSDLPVEYTTTLNISGNTLIQKKTNLYLTTLLINRHNGAIVNAAQLPLGAGASTGIDGVASENGIQEVARYNANGVKLSAPQKGLNIIKLNNGKTIKVMVK